MIKNGDECVPGSTRSASMIMREGEKMVGMLSDLNLNALVIIVIFDSENYDWRTSVSMELFIATEATSGVDNEEGEEGPDSGKCEFTDDEKLVFIGGMSLLKHPIIASDRPDGGSNEQEKELNSSTRKSQKWFSSPHGSPESQNTGEDVSEHSSNEIV